MTKRTLLSLFVLIAFFAACKTGSKADMTTPKGTAESIFSAAKSGDFSHLKEAISETADSDCKKIGEVSGGDTSLQKSFKEYFAKGTVVGDPTIEGETAKVNIKFGPDGTKEETFNMVKKDGKWLLESF